MLNALFYLPNGYRQDYGPWYLAIINGEVLETTHLIDFHKDRNDGLDFIARIAGDEHAFTFQGKDCSYADLYNGYYSTSANGYSRLTNGVVIQWGYCGANNGGSTRATFPITFSSVFAICDTQYAGADIGVYDSNCYILSKDTSGFTFRTDNSNAKIHWIAIGV